MGRVQEVEERHGNEDPQEEDRRSPQGSGREEAGDGQQGGSPESPVEEDRRAEGRGPACRQPVDTRKVRSGGRPVVEEDSPPLAEVTRPACRGRRRSLHSRHIGSESGG